MTDQIKSVRFRYAGVMREVDNIDEDKNIICGFEMRKGGKFSYKIKRYSKRHIEGDVIVIPPVRRSGPVIGRA